MYDKKFTAAIICREALDNFPTNFLAVGLENNHHVFEGQRNFVTDCTIFHLPNVLEVPRDNKWEFHDEAGFVCFSFCIMQLILANQSILVLGIVKPGAYQSVLQDSWIYLLPGHYVKEVRDRLNWK